MRAKSTKHKPEPAAKPQPAPPAGDTGRALLAQALEAPDDPAPHLIYADWLEERGHPLAELIRLQLAGKPTNKSSERHRATWLEPIASWLVEPVFERGMIRRIYGSPGAYTQRATQAALLAAATTFGVRETMLRGACKKLDTAESLAWTTSLFWWDCQLDDALLAALVDSPHVARLWSLTLEKVRITNRGLAALARSRALVRLRRLALPAPVAMGSFDAAGILGVLEHRGLSELALTGLHRLQIGTLVASQHVGTLTRLSVATRHVRAIASSPHLTALTSLDVSSLDHVDDDDVAPFLDNPAFGKLTAVLLKLWGPSARKPSAKMVARLAARFGPGFTYETSGTPAVV